MKTRETADTRQTAQSVHDEIRNITGAYGKNKLNGFKSQAGEKDGSDFTEQRAFFQEYAGKQAIGNEYQKIGNDFVIVSFPVDNGGSAERNQIDIPDMRQVSEGKLYFKKYDPDKSQKIQNQKTDSYFFILHNTYLALQEQSLYLCKKYNKNKGSVFYFSHAKILRFSYERGRVT
jgi:hypothetical protein